MEGLQFYNLKTDRREQIFHFSRRKDLLVPEQMRGIHGIQERRKSSTRQAVGECAGLMIKTIPAGCINEQVPTLLQDIGGALESLPRVIDVFDDIPECYTVKVLRVS